MRILTRYILKEISTHAALWLVVFTFIIFIFTPHVTRLMELAVRHDLGRGETLELLALPLPSILVLTIPMAVLVGILIGLSRMSADGEVVAARASGLGLRQFVLPVMILALAGLAAASWMSLDLGPAAGAALSRREGALATSQAPHEVQPRVFIEQFPNWLLYIEKADCLSTTRAMPGWFYTSNAAPRTKLTPRIRANIRSARSAKPISRCPSSAAAR